MENRTDKIEEMVRHIAAEFIERESNKQALITVSRVGLFDHNKSATIFITVLPDTYEQAALNFLKRKRAELRTAMMKKLRIHPIPFLDVAIDNGEKARHTIDALLRSDE